MNSFYYLKIEAQAICILIDYDGKLITNWLLHLAKLLAGELFQI